MFSRINNDTEKIAHNGALRHIIENALIKASFHYRKVFSLREIYGLSISETAKLRKAIGQPYFTNELFGFNLIYCDAIAANVMSKINEL